MSKNLNLADKGWFQKYLLLRKDLKKSTQSQTPPTEDHHFYKEVQPSGLMYGHPIVPTEIGGASLENITANEKMKVVMAEGLLKSAQIESENISDVDYQDFVNEFAKELVEYYLELYPEASTKRGFFSNKKQSSDKIAEEILDKRLYIKGSLFENFWSSFFHNSLLFLDVFYFRQWLKEKDKIATLDDLRNQKDNVRLSLLKLIAAASNADNVIEKEERKLYNIFLKSANLDQKKTKEASSFIDDGLTLDDIDIPGDSWILKKYFLEMAVLTVWADRVVAEEEKEFLQKLSKKLDFTEEEMENSMLAIESFVLSNWDEVHYLQTKKNYEMVSKLLVKRLTKVAVKNKNRIGTEIQESKELMDLMSASISRDLTANEKEKVREQLIDILKMLPTFVIIALPGTFLTLPILLKILPKSAFPSAFQE